MASLKKELLEDDSAWAPVKAFQEDLGRRLKLHRPAIENYWRTSTPRKQKECIDAALPKFDTTSSPAFSTVLRYCAAVGEVSRLKAKPALLLELFDYRATATLLGQYVEGPNGSGGDREFSRQFVLKTREMGIGLPESLRETYKGNTYTFFFDDESFGETRERVKGTDDLDPELQPLLDRGECVPEPFGYLVYERQASVFRFLLRMIALILERGSTSRCPPVLGLNYQGVRENLSEVLSTNNIAFATVSNVADYINNFITRHNILLNQFKEGGYLELFVLRQYCNHPGFIPDEDGCVLPVSSDHFLSRAFFRLSHETRQILAIWKYIRGLLMSVTSKPATNSSQDCLLSEMSTALQHSYIYHQSHLRQLIQINEGAAYFSRLYGQCDKSGKPVIVMKNGPQDNPESSRRLRCLVDLSRSKTTIPKALELLRDWNEHDKTTPGFDGGLYGEEFEALFNLSVAATSAQELGRFLALPNPHLKKEDSFVGRFRRLQAEIEALEGQVDLQDFVAPLGNLREPGVAGKAWQALDNLMVVQIGSTIQAAYDTLVEESLSDVRQKQSLANERRRETVEVPDLVKLAKTHPSGQVHLPASALLPQPEPRASPAQPTKNQESLKANKPQHGKENAHPLVAELTISKKPAAELTTVKKKDDTRSRTVEKASTSARPTPSQPENISNKRTEEGTDCETEPRLKVSRSAKQVFDTLFAKSRKAQGAISWKDFGSAMVEAGLSIIPTAGSEYKFVPAPGSKLKTSMVVHKPHQPGNSKKIEGSKATAVRRQLRRELGWDENTFESK